MSPVCLMRGCPVLSRPRTWSNQEVTREAAVQSEDATWRLACEGDVAVTVHANIPGFWYFSLFFLPKLVKFITFAYELSF